MMTLQHKFVEYVPNILEDGFLYISIQYRTAVHKCVCGCGSKVVTPISPTDWKLIFNGKSVSLYPSIGNWNFECQSHYWIKENKIEYARNWSNKEIQKGRSRDDELKKLYYEDRKSDFEVEPTRTTLWRRIFYCINKFGER